MPHLRPLEGFAEWEADRESAATGLGDRLRPFGAEGFGLWSMLGPRLL